jgi:hypothetical protein
LLARGGVAGEIALSAFLSYSSPWPRAETVIDGEAATLATDGFSYLRRNGVETLLELNAEETYESAIEQQDRAFVAACRGEATGIGWQETVRLMRRPARRAEPAHQRR